MHWNTQTILDVLDQCCACFSFPMLDNGYCAATRLSLYRSTEDWAMVIEVFGFSPRSGMPDTQIYTFASRLRRDKKPEHYVSESAYNAYLENHPHNEPTFIFPIQKGSWQTNEYDEQLAPGTHNVHLRDHVVQTPALAAYADCGIALQDPPKVQIFELCRFLAATERDRVLATPEERGASVPPELEHIMQLEAWFHPDIAHNERASTNPTFCALAAILAGADVASYQPSMPPNTHWQHWLDGGTL